MAEVFRLGEPDNASEAQAIRTLAEELPKSYQIYHNFELTTGRGLPYEFDVVIVGDYGVWNVEIKGYRGIVRGDRSYWRLSNGNVQPSPIALAYKKSRILAWKLKDSSGLKEESLYVDSAILFTDKRVKLKIRDRDAERILVPLAEAKNHFTDPARFPLQPKNLKPLLPQIQNALLGGAREIQKIEQVGLYDIEARLNQTDTRTVFLAKHRYITTRPQTILKVYHFDVYASEKEKERQIQAIFHDQDALRILGAHPCLVQTGDIFPWEDNQFVLPTEYIEEGQPLSVLFEKDELAWDLEGEGSRAIGWGEKLSWVHKMARGLCHAHRHGVIHRDIRPLSVVVAPDGTCKLVNFDLALIQSQPELGDLRLHRLRRRFDASYVAPEVWEEPKSADMRSDIYSLGMVFYQLLTGQVPYEDIEVVLQMESGSAVDGKVLRESLAAERAEDAVAVIERMTQRRPEDRYASMDEVMEDLKIIDE